MQEIYDNRDKIFYTKKKPENKKLGMAHKTKNIYIEFA